MGVQVEASAKKPYSMDRNLLHISFEAGILEDPWFDAFSVKNRDMFKLSVAPEDAPNKPEYVLLDFAVKDSTIIVSDLEVKKQVEQQVSYFINQVGSVEELEKIFIILSLLCSWLVLTQNVYLLTEATISLLFLSNIFPLCPTIFSVLYPCLLIILSSFGFSIN